MLGTESQPDTRLPVVTASARSFPALTICAAEGTSQMMASTCPPIA